MKMKCPVVFFRNDENTQDEFLKAKEYFNVFEHRSKIKDSIVIGRYSVLPYYKELELDLRDCNSTLINTYSQHLYIADFQYYHTIEKHTAKSYFMKDWGDIPEHGKFVVKGYTNSRKFEWASKMFADNKRDAINLANNLMNDFLLGSQGIVIREYLPLEILEYGVTGMPFANEHRFFCYKNKILASGYYWSISEKHGKLDENAIPFVKMIMSLVSPYVNFYVIDIARMCSGEWVVIELNDGQMSGLSEVDPAELYKNLSIALA